MHTRILVAFALLLFRVAAAQGPVVVLSEHVLRPDPAAVRDGFGQALSVSPERIAIGAPQSAAQPSGTGYVVLHVPAAGGGWQEEARLFASDGAQGDRFGAALALDGDTLLVGAPGNDPCGLGCGDAGAVYAFERQAGAWTEVQKLERQHAFVLDAFGSSIALAGDTAVVGAPGADGYVLRFERRASVWIEMEEWIQSGGTDFAQQYGSAVDLDGARAVVGAPGLDSAGYDSGAGFVWEASGGAWSEAVRLEPSGAATLTSAGRAVAVEGDTIVLGATSPFSAGPGAAWVFDAEGAWTEQAELVGADSLDGDDFGAALALEAGRLAVGAPHRTSEAGALYLFGRGPAGWSQLARIEAGVPAGARRFGASVALVDELLVVGAPDDDHVASDAGAVHVFQIVDAFESYCIATPNSSGRPAALDGSGSTSVAADDLLLQAAPVPLGQFGVFYYGAEEVLVPFGDGFRCVGSGASALYRLPIELAAGDQLSHALDLSAPPQASGQIRPGSLWRFQAWFRDPLAGGSGFNLSDAARVLFVP